MTRSLLCSGKKWNAHESTEKRRYMRCFRLFCVRRSHSLTHSRTRTCFEYVLRLRVCSLSSLAAPHYSSAFLHFLCFSRVSLSPNSAIDWCWIENVFVCCAKSAIFRRCIWAEHCSFGFCFCLFIECTSIEHVYIDTNNHLKIVFPFSTRYPPMCIFFFCRSSFFSFYMSLASVRWPLRHMHRTHSSVVVSVAVRHFVAAAADSFCGIHNYMERMEHEGTTTHIHTNGVCVRFYLYNIRRMIVRNVRRHRPYLNSVYYYYYTKYK